MVVQFTKCTFDATCFGCRAVCFAGTKRVRLNVIASVWQTFCGRPYMCMRVFNGSAVLSRSRRHQPCCVSPRAATKAGLYLVLKHTWYDLALGRHRVACDAVQVHPAVRGTIVSTVPLPVGNPPFFFRPATEVVACSLAPWQAARYVDADVRACTPVWSK